MRTPALDGGTPAFDANEAKALWPGTHPDELDGLRRVLDSGVWSRSRDSDWAGGEVGRFEAALGGYLGAEQVTATANGTVAIEFALAALGVGPGDEVIVPASTFFASVSPVVRLGAIPVFADIDPATFTISPASVAERVTSRTVGVLVVHLAGIPVDLDAIGELCARHSLFLVEDCAQALGSTWRGRQVGTFGDAGTFSFHQEKQLTAGEGGAVATRDPAVAGRVFAHHNGFWMRGAPKQDKHEVSTNGRLTPFQAAVLSARLPRLDEQVEHRAANAEALRAAVVDGVEQVTPLAATTRWSLFAVPFRVDPEQVSRDKLVEALSAEGVSAHEGHLDPVYRRPLFLDNPIDHRNDGCPEAERAADVTGFVISHKMFLGPRAWMTRLGEVLDELVSSGRVRP
ncbi:DegT/DnrJ/EryC1/StrS family aminotransferase [Lentzea sp. NPDC042327]|uniref:DegT/DnrJ/EryC1/StrS family aminotransferase n=1 Tax=Lentzea sp. NPDC042327 TaxID=3154801 RepID=UPI0033EA4C81